MHIPDRAVAQHEPLSAKPPSWPAQVGKAVPFWGCHWEGLSFTWLGAEGWDLLTVGGFPCWRSKFKAAKLWHDFKHLLFDMSHGILMAQPAPVGVGHPSREAKRRQAGAGALPTAQPSSRGCADPPTPGAQGLLLRGGGPGCIFASPAPFLKPRLARHRRCLHRQGLGRRSSRPSRGAAGEAQPQPGSRPRCGRSGWRARGRRRHRVPAAALPRGPSSAPVATLNPSCSPVRAENVGELGLGGLTPLFLRPFLRIWGGAGSISQQMHVLVNWGVPGSS